MFFPNWAKNFLFLLVFMISGLVLLIIIQGLASGTDLTPLNTAIERMVMRTRTPVLTTILVAITRLSDPLVLALVAVIVSAFLVVRNRSYDAVLFMVALVLTGIALIVLKNTFQITRPASEFLQFEGWSFPSGHATVATAFFFLAAYSFVGRIHSLGGKMLLIFGSIVGATAVCFSRLYLGAHWTLDILAGIALGFLCVSLTILGFNVFIEKRRSLRSRME